MLQRVKVDSFWFARGGETADHSEAEVENIARLFLWNLSPSLALDNRDQPLQPMEFEGDGGDYADLDAHVTEKLEASGSQ